MQKSHVLLLAALLLLPLLALWLVLAPAEARLGDLMKLVYVHGALVWVGLAVFSVSGGLGLLALATRRAVWDRGTRAAGATALIVWIACSISAMVVTRLTWGQAIAWNEPRVRVTALILITAVAAEVAIWFVRRGVFRWVVHILVGIVAWVAVQRAGVIRHPADPIGSSESTAIQVYYWLIVLTVAGLVSVLLTWLWLRLDSSEPRLARGAKSDQTAMPPVEST